ncbi:peroxide stress protein YaaA [Corynebacterium sp. TAE3-ERU12]|uniref:YaaA family protein n=1 Tax=Corynebacterium sp. TAE3-ERU12 TaxID=2849491 RepID=UPI001C477482|nr:peroxide stress protein YaaA [Corynebacterium sp. TAE3-ERU12]MBV7295239.1 peroxide stress protein YaaA [Corynebacterium sp. TAE3-ERU12]
MRIILPPSETKAAGGDLAPLSLADLSFPALNDIRSDIANDLVALAADEDTAMDVLGIGPRLAEYVDADANLFTSPTMPAVQRYTGVLYDALAADSLSEAACDRLLIGSALFGVVAANDAIPQYRLSASVKLPYAHGAGTKAPTMKARWGKELSEALNGLSDVVIDLRSGAYEKLGPVTGAVTARVVTEEGKVVSHANKQHKGLLARALACADVAEAIVDVDSAVSAAREAGLDVELIDGVLTITTH